MTEKLKPCPFCGSNDIRAMPMPLVNDDPADGRWWVGCVNAIDHDAAAFADTKKKAIAAWNTRATGWRPIEEAPKLDGKRLLLRLGEEGVSVAYWDAYYSEGGRGCTDGFAWIEPCSGDPLNLHYKTPPTHFMLITPPDSEAPHD